MYYVYVLQDRAERGSFYLGCSADLRERVAGHNAGNTKSTRRKSWRLVYYEAYLKESAARERERALKRDARVKRFLMDRIKRSLERDQEPE